MKRCHSCSNAKRARHSFASLCAITALSGLAISITNASAAAAAECANPNALGVSRVVALDTSKGPKYGLQQYKQHDFLKPKEVVLTFDDGPTNIYTIPILKALKAHCTKATFFMVGEMARANPALVRKVAALGHTVGTHTWSHQNLGRRSKKRSIKEIELAISVISKALGRPAAPFFRFPYLSDPKRMIKHLQGRNIGIFSIDVDSKDYLTRSGTRVTNKIMRDLKRDGKGIILFHDIQKSTARAIPGLLKKLKAKGYKVVHIKPKDKGVTDADFDLTAARMFERKTGGKRARSSGSEKAGRRVARRRGAKRPAVIARAKPRHRRAKTRNNRKTTKLRKKSNWAESFFQGG